MQILKSAITLSLLLGIYTSNVIGQGKSNTLTAALQQLVEKDSLPGMSVVLVNAKQVIYEQNFGYANFERGIRYSSKSIQNIGSVSKTFAAIALMKAIELGYFDLDADINTILPFKVTNPHNPAGIITVRQLSTHTSGIIDNPAILPNSYHFDTTLVSYNLNAYKLLKSLGYQQKINDASLKTFMYDYLAEKGKYYNQRNFGSGAPGSTYTYSNIASALVAYLIEERSGLTYAEFTQRYILNPLKMKNSGWYINSKQLSKYALPYYNLYSSFPLYHYITYPDGGLRTNTAELGKYLMVLINGYNGNDKLISRASYITMYAAQFSKDNTPKGINLSNRNKGIFWNLYNDGTIGHDGDDPGVSSFLFFNPKTGLGGVFLCNKYMEDKSKIIKLLVEFADSK